MDIETTTLENALNKLPSKLTKNLEKNLCVCNEVPKIKIIHAIINGATSIPEIKQQTYATMGMGCCTQQIEQFIQYLHAPDTT